MRSCTAATAGLASVVRVVMVSIAARIPRHKLASPNDPPTSATYRFPFFAQFLCVSESDIGESKS